MIIVSTEGWKLLLNLVSFFLVSSCLVLSQKWAPILMGKLSVNQTKIVLTSWTWLGQISFIWTNIATSTLHNFLSNNSLWSSGVVSLKCYDLNQHVVSNNFNNICMINEGTEDANSLKWRGTFQQAFHDTEGRTINVIPWEKKEMVKQLISYLVNYRNRLQ